MIAAKTLGRSSAYRTKRRAKRGGSLYSIVQMPRGIPVGTLAIGKAGAAMRPCWPRKSCDA
ncbi:AIR carboxylase family protein [Shigella flexneri]